MAERDNDTEILFPGSDGDVPSPKRRKRRGRGWIIAGSVVVVFLVLVVVAFFLTDGLIRSSAEAIAAKEIEQRLPANVTGTVNVKIDGGPVLLQYLSGSFDHIELDAPDLDADGIPAAVHVDARGVPTDLSKPVKTIAGTVKLDQDAVNKALKVPNASSGITLGQGVVSYNGSQTVLGVPIGYTVTAKPSVSGPDILLTPTDIHVTSGPVNLDLTGTINSLLGKNPVPVCVAGQLPKALTLKSVDVTPSDVTLSLTASNIVLDNATFESKGTC